MKNLIKDLKYAYDHTIEYESAKKLKRNGLKIGLPILIGGVLAIMLFFGLSALSFFHHKIALGVFSCILSFLSFGIAILGIIITSYAANIQLKNEKPSAIKQDFGICPTCGAELNSNNFCDYCNSKIKKD